MSTAHPPLPDSPSSPTPPVTAPTPASKPSTGPPMADTVVRPFTSQGAMFTSTHATSDRPSTARAASVEPPDGEPYMSASARTSYTRVDVDSLPAPVYPPLPPLPAAFATSTPSSPLPYSMPLPASTSETAQSAPAQSGERLDPVIPHTPHVSLTFLLVSGRRKTLTFEPETTVGRVKELVWNAWPVRDADWPDERPPAPSYLRILYLGKILQDDDTLLRVGFPTSLPSASTPTIVHLSIRPYVLASDDAALSKKRRLSIAMRRLSSAGPPADDEEERGRGCCTGCTIC